MVFLLQLVPGVSPIPIYTTALPLAVILGVSMLREAVEDLRRHNADALANGAPCTKIGKQGGLVKVRSQDLAIGDTCVIYRGQEVPADVVLVGSSAEGGSCFVSTCNLDGESSHKIRKPSRGMSDLDSRDLDSREGSSRGGSGDSLRGSSDMLEGSLVQIVTPLSETLRAEFGSLRGAVHCEPPSVHLEQFNGRIEWSVPNRPCVLLAASGSVAGSSSLAVSEADEVYHDSMGGEGDVEGDEEGDEDRLGEMTPVTSVDVGNVLLRGAQLVATGWCVGVVASVGPMTKLALNVQKSHYKFSSLEARLNRSGSTRRWCGGRRRGLECRCGDVCYVCRVSVCHPSSPLLPS
jgi:magnesium-transporting ATPase (P-type)